MRKLKVLLGNNYPIYNHTITTLVNNGIITDLALLKADLDDLSKKTSIPTQCLRVLRHKVALLSVVPETNKDFDQTRFSTGFQTLDDFLYGGFCLGHTIEVTGLHRVINAEFSLYAVESFLSSFPDATVHYIYTTGMIDSRQMEAVISRAQARHKRQHKSDQIMQRIQCYSVVTPTDACQLLVQIGALHLSSPTTPSLIVMSDIVHLLETEWDNTTDQRSSLAQSLKSVNNLGLSTIVLHTITGDPKLEKPRSMKAQGLMEQWNSAIDIRLLLAYGGESNAGTMCKVVKARSTKISNKTSLALLEW